MSFGNRLKALREKADLSREELASKLNISYSAVSKYETDVRFPDKETLNLIADFFAVSTDYLLSRSDTYNHQESRIETKAYHNLDTSGLSDEDIAYINALIAGIKARKKS